MWEANLVSPNNASGLERVFFVANNLHLIKLNTVVKSKQLVSDLGIPLSGFSYRPLSSP